jgi:hypothetical protein
MREHVLQPGHILTGALFSEPMRVETVRAHGVGVWEVGLMGMQSERFRKVTLTSRDFVALTIQESLPTYAGDVRLLRLGLQAYMLGIAHEIFTQRIPHTVDFQIDGAAFALYQDVTRFVKRQSARAAAQSDDPRARAVGFLMALYQRRLASSTYAMRRSLQNRASRLTEGLQRAQTLARQAPPVLPDPEELEEMEEGERDRLERPLEAITLAGSAAQVHEEGAPLSWRPSADAVAGHGAPLSWRPSADAVAGHGGEAGAAQGPSPYRGFLRRP